LGASLILVHIRILSRDEFNERFEVAEPGKEFDLYSEACFKRVH